VKGWIVCGLIELIAFVVGALLCYAGYVAWYVVPLFLLIPPALAAIAVVASIGSAARNGGNPFQ
jgi:hypothetical protein